MSAADGHKFTGMRMENEGDRSPEFKEARDKLVDDVNAWLVQLAEKRDGGEKIHGIAIQDKPRIVRTMLGRTAAGTGSLMEEKSGGISLTGGKTTKRLELQAVLPQADGAGVVSIEALGSDPVEKLVDGDEYSEVRTNRIDVSFVMTEETDGQEPRYFGYKVSGTGAVARQFIDARGYHTGQAIRTVEEIDMAAGAFAQVRAVIE